MNRRKFSLRPSLRAARTVAAACFAVAAQVAAAGSTALYTDMHDFGATITPTTGTAFTDGIGPSPVTFDAAGNMYGTTAYGGLYGATAEDNASGTIWEITTAGKYIDLHDFGTTYTNTNNVVVKDGNTPSSGVTFDKTGNMYGTAQFGGAYDLGMVWEITSKGVYMDLHDFGSTVTDITTSPTGTAPDGIYPTGGVGIDSAGDLFGTTVEGGPNGPSYADGEGIVWEISASGTYADIHDFGGSITSSLSTAVTDGTYPYAGVTLDTAGNLYGTASSGGAYEDANGEGGDGMIWELSSTSSLTTLQVPTYTDLHDFGGTITNASGASGLDGAGPVAGLIFDAAGNKYGTTEGGGPNDTAEGGSGMIWEITKAGVYKDLHDFGGQVTISAGTTGLDGTNPTTGIIFDASGNIYGTTSYGGPNKTANSVYGAGMLYEIQTPNATTPTYVDIHDFGGSITNSSGTVTPDGANPQSLVIDTNGNLLGTSLNGGVNNSTDGGDGMVWSFTHGLVSISLNPTSVTGGSSSTATVTIADPAPDGGSTVYLTSGTTSAVVPATVTVPAGETTQTFTVTTTAVTAETNATITATQTGLTASAVLQIQTASGNVALAHASVIGGNTTTATITLNGPAPKGGLKVPLTSNNSNYAAVPSSVTVPAGSNVVSFAVSTSPVVSSPVNIVISAKVGSATKTAALQVLPAVLQSITLSKTSIVGGSGTVTATVTFNGIAPAAGRIVPVASTNTSYAAVPTSVVVSSKASSATFTVTTHPVTSQKTITILAYYGTVKVTATLVIQP
jgi:hypothetical protein